MNSKFSIILVLLMLAAGCSSGGEFEPDTFSRDDLCIERVTDSDMKVCYGMDRSEAEKVLGKGGKSDQGWFNYENGILIIYRDSEVALIKMDENSKGQFKTTRGIEIGILRQNVLKLFGEKHERHRVENSAGYYYDTHNEEFITEKRADLRYSPEEMEGIYVFTADFDSNGYVDGILLSDQRMAMYLE